MDDSLISDPIANPFSGLRRGGAALVNTTKPKESLLPGRQDVTVLAVDLTGMALKTLGKPILSAGIAAAVARVSGIKQEALIDAVVAQLQDIGLSEEMIDKNVEFANMIYSELVPLKFSTQELPTTEELVPLAVVVTDAGIEKVLNTGNSGARHTGNWRTFRPTIDYAKCTNCMICYAYCPESAMSVGQDGRVKIDYDNCKGCMICMTECPLRAVSQSREGAVQ